MPAEIRFFFFHIFKLSKRKEKKHVSTHEIKNIE